MGRLNPEAPPSSDQAPSIVHFSHPHPLQLSNPQTLPHNFSCSACCLNDDAVGPIYTCKPCNFTLHLSCYQLPQQINHPFHPHHDLTLQPRPVYPGGLFCCDACGNLGAGFSYNCGPCGFDLHTTCATLPTQFAHKSHQHRLGIHCAAPYPGNVFSCDVCSRAGSKTWVYRCCEGCEFDAHLTCVAKLDPGLARIQQPQQMGSVNYNNASPPQASYGAPPRTQGQFTGNQGYPFNDNMNQQQPVYGVVIALVQGLAKVFALSFIQGIFSGYDGTDGGYDSGDSTY